MDMIITIIPMIATVGNCSEMSTTAPEALSIANRAFALVVVSLNLDSVIADAPRTIPEIAITKAI